MNRLIEEFNDLPLDFFPITGWATDLLGLFFVTAVHSDVCVMQVMYRETALCILMYFIFILFVSACPYYSQFRCGSGECVYNVYRCNGRADCRDGSDEICSLYSHLLAQIQNFTDVCIALTSFVWQWHQMVLVCRVLVDRCTAHALWHG